MLEPRLLEWPLTADDVVVDGGAWAGDFCFPIAERYGSKVHAFEMMHNAAVLLGASVRRGLPVTVYPVGLAGEDGTAEVVNLESMSSLYQPKSNAYHLHRVQMRDIVSVLDGLDVDEIALLKLNIEGSEYGVLERLLSSPWALRVRRFLIQFHNLGERPSARRDAIRGVLKETHRELWCDPWKWEAWERK